MGLLVGGLWAMLLGLFVLFMQPPLAMLAIATGISWVYGICLLGRWATLHGGVALHLGPAGFVQSPCSQEISTLQPWGPGLEIIFAQKRKVWGLQINEGFHRPVDIILPAATDSEVDSIREKLSRWQPNRVLVEKL